jgi:hypothetical protein
MHQNVILNFKFILIMKKLLVLLFVLGVSIPSFAKLKEKDVVGSWKFSIETDQGTMTGNLKFEIKEKKLAGEATTDMGGPFTFTKVEIRDNNVLYFELQPEYEVISVVLTVDGNRFEGTVGGDGGEIPITGEKVE